MQKNKIVKYIPDAINQSTVKNYTQIPNDMLRNPKISSKSKTILCILLSNKKGWTSHITGLEKVMKEGENAIRSGLSELEKFGYLIRVRYRNKVNKTMAGSFWSYTDIPYKFNMKDTIKFLDENGFEINWKDIKIDNEPHVENRDVDKQDVENMGVIILKDNNINNNKNLISAEADMEDNDENSSNQDNQNKKTQIDYSKYDRKNLDPKIIRMTRFFQTNIEKPLTGVKGISTQKYFSGTKISHSIIYEDQHDYKIIRRLMNRIAKDIKLNEDATYRPRFFTLAEFRKKIPNLIDYYNRKDNESTSTNSSSPKSKQIEDKNKDITATILKAAKQRGQDINGATPKFIENLNELSTWYAPYKEKAKKCCARTSAETNYHHDKYGLEGSYAEDSRVRACMNIPPFYHFMKRYLEYVERFAFGENSSGLQPGHFKLNSPTFNSFTKWDTENYDYSFKEIENFYEREYLTGKSTPSKEYENRN